MSFSRSRKILFTILTTIVLFIVLELVTLTMFHIFRDRFTFYSSDKYILEQEDVDRLSPWFDAGLGWSFHYDTPFSERKRENDYGRALISSFGDSYTHCTDVENDETWQYYISDILQADVYNFGIGGYGTDQAYLRFLEIAPALKTGIVVIGLTPENINRIVNVYRPFYFQKTGIKLPKPRFTLEKGTLRLLENPIQDIEGISLLTDRNFVVKLGENDWWFNRDEYPVLGFPYLRILLNKRIWLEAFHGKVKGGPIDDTMPRPWEDLWNNEEVSSLMYAILEDFIGGIRSHGSVPVVMISAMQPDVFHRFMTGNDPDPVAKIKSFCDSADCLCFNAVEVLASSVSKMEEIPRLYEVHVSAEGNRRIAEKFAVFIEDMNLLNRTKVYENEE